MGLKYIAMEVWSKPIVDTNATSNCRMICILNMYEIFYIHDLFLFSGEAALEKSYLIFGFRLSEHPPNAVPMLDMKEKEKGEN